LHLVGILFPRINDDAGQTHIKFKMFVVSIKLLSEIFFILRRTQRDTIKTVQWS